MSQLPAEVSMPRKILIRASDFPYHVVARVNNRDWFYIPIEDVWIECLRLIKKGQLKFQIKIYAFVLMSNHYHLCIQTPLANIDSFMQFFNKALAEFIAKGAGRVNRIFGGPYKWTLITSEAYFQNVIRYVYQNPLRANMCQRCEDYPFSDLSFKNPRPEYLTWLNNRQSDYDTQKTRKNLRRYQI